MYLNCHSFHSLRYGTIPLLELVKQASECQVEALCLTDINTVTGIYDFIKACKEVAIKPLVGIEFRQNNQLLYVGIAKSSEGLGELNRFLSHHNLSGSKLPLVAPDFKHVSVIYPLENVPQELQLNEHVGIRPDQLSLLFQTKWAILLDKMVVFQPVTFRTKSEFNLHKILRAIDSNIILTKLSEADYCKTSDVLIPLSALIEKYKDYPQILTNTQKLIDGCNFEFNFSTPKNKKFYTKDQKSDMELLTNLAYQGMLKIYGKHNLEAKARVEKELKVIDELKFSGYFLITWDIIRYSNSMGFLHIGRFPIVQFDMHIAEDIGFEKFDILSQRGIGHIDETVKLIAKNRGIKVDIRDTRISKNEALCNEYLAVGKTIGCFYIESPAMRGLLRRLSCNNYKTLVAASSIIRPGVAKSGMMKEYVFRHNHPNQFEYLHAVFEKHLGETYGIMVYQEDVIKIALYFGGLAAADGDILRRAMSGKGRSAAALKKVKDNFFDSCAKQGHSLELTSEIYRQIESFAGYSFCKAHSASYAVESYQSLYLKAHYPIEFMVAVINNQGGFYRTEVYVHELKMAGGIIHNPCVNKSVYDTTLYGNDVYLGFMLLQSLPSKIALEMMEEREQNGDYLSLEDFINRVSIGIETLQTLIFIGAFRFTGQSKNQLLVVARLILVNFKPENRNLKLIQEPVKEYKLPVLARAAFEDAFDEIEIIGFTVSCTPFDLLKTKFRGDILVDDLLKNHKKTVRMMAYLIARKQVPTTRGDMYFGTWIDAKGSFFDTAHFPDSLNAFPFQGGGCYLLLGTVEVDYHFPTITVTKMAKMPFVPDPRYSNSDEKQYKVHQQLREDVSSTQRAPYPQEVNLPRHKMG